MRATAITGLVLGALAPLVMLLPLLGLVAGDDAFRSVGWAFLFFTVPLGFLLAIAGGVLCIVAAGLGLRRRGAHPLPIVGIVLIGVGLVLDAVGVAGVVSGDATWGMAAFGAGLAAGVAGIVSCAVSALRRVSEHQIRAAADSPAPEAVG